MEQTMERMLAKMNSFQAKMNANQVKMDTNQEMLARMEAMTEVNL
jgi:hypothetical protein